MGGWIKVCSVHNIMCVRYKNFALNGEVLCIKIKRRGIVMVNTYESPEAVHSMLWGKH
ncbi:hypothetical protein [Butyrivibrio sp. AE3003]|uniref:hypothetical protein n=1 Tax=Butyrivibrio sp. AE3003 TaxID=1496721 RepID=UPI001A99EE78|nr:hypothetical protein [Butyrivibrio sp. AE3003]